MLELWSVQPTILLLDEPTGSLDKENSDNIMELLKKIHSLLNTTIIMVTHSYELAQQCSQIIFLKDGKINDEPKETKLMI